MALVVSIAEGVSNGTPGASIGGYHSITNVNSVDDLSDRYYDLGVSGNVAGVTLGADVLTMYPDGEYKNGLSLSAAVSTPGVEAHYMRGKTVVITSSDIWEQIKIYF